MREHVHRVWCWTTCTTPTVPPRSMTGWWSRCTCCPPDSAKYLYNQLASERGRRWWEYVFPYRFGARPVR